MTRKRKALRRRKESSSQTVPAVCIGFATISKKGLPMYWRYSVVMKGIEDRKNIYRTYVYDTAEKYVIVLEPQRSPYGYYLLTAYYLNMPGGEKKMKKMLKKKLEEVL